MQKRFADFDRALPTESSQRNQCLFQSVDDAEAATINGGWAFSGSLIKRQPARIVIDFTSAG